MKKLLILIPIIACYMAACDFEMSDNGDLDGYWQCRQIDTLATGGTTDMRPASIFLSVQAHMLEFRDNTRTDRNIIFRFEKAADILRLWNPVADNRQVSDSLIHNPQTLECYAITDVTVKADSTLETQFRITDFSSDNMTLMNSKYRLHYRKY